MSQQDLDLHVDAGRSDDERGDEDDTDSVEYAKSPLHIRFNALDQRWSAKKLADGRSSPETVKSTDSFHSDAPSVRRTNTTTSRQTPPTPQQSGQSKKAVQIIGSPDFIPMLLDEGTPLEASRSRRSSRRSVGSETGSVFDRLYNHGKKKVATARQREIDARMSPSNSGASPSDTSHRYSPSHSAGGSTISTLSSAGSVHDRLYRNEKRTSQRRKSHNLVVPSSSRSVSSLDRRKAYSNELRADHSSRLRSSTSAKRPSSARSSRSVASVTTSPPAFMSPNDIKRAGSIDEISVSTAPTRSNTVFDRLYRGEKRSTESLLPESYRTPKAPASTPKIRSRINLPITRRQESDATPLRKGGRTKQEIADNNDGDHLSGIFDASFAVPDDRNASFATARIQDSPAMDDSFYSTVSDGELSPRNIGDEDSSGTDESLLVDRSFFNEDEDDSFTSARTTQRSESSLLHNQQISMQTNVNAAKTIQQAVRVFLSGPPRLRREIAAIKLQSSWRQYRSQLALVDRMLVGWWMKCDYQSSSDYNSVLVLKMGLESLKKAIRQVYGSAHAGSIDIQSERIVVEWTKEVVVHIEVKGSLVMECAVLRLKCSTRRPSFVQHWSSSKTADLIVRTTLERVLKRDEDKFLHASATIIQRWIRNMGARERLESHGLHHLVDVTNLVLREKFLSPTSAHRKAAIRIQSAMRCHRAQLQACTRLLKSWWLKCDFQSSMTCGRILLMKIGLLGVTKAIGQVDCCWVTDNMEIHETSIHLAWQREVGIHFVHNGVPRLESCIVKLSCQAGRSSVTAGWEQRKLAILFIKAALIRVAKRDQAALVVASTEAIQSWWRMVPARRCHLDMIRVQRVKAGDIAARRTSAVVVLQRNVRCHQAQAVFVGFVEMVVRIQTLARASQDRCHYKKTRQAISLIQTMWRSTLNRETSKKLRACVIIQSTLREYTIARKAQCESSYSALVIQRAWRRRDTSAEYQKLENAGVLILQKHARTWLSQRSFIIRRHSSIVVQCWYRRHVARRTRNEREAHAAILLQRHARCRQAQRRHTILLASIVTIQASTRSAQTRQQYQRKVIAILLLQKAWRLALTLKRAVLMETFTVTRCREAACTIQRTWRTYSAFSAYRTLRARVCVIQKWARVRSSQTRLTMERQEAIRIQKWYRHAIREHANKNRAIAAMIIQQAVRGHQARAFYVQMLESILKIQKTLRAYQARGHYQQTQIAALRIQEAWRTLQWQRTRQVQASVKIQSFFGQHSTRNSMRKAVWKAALIQKAWRRHAANAHAEAEIIGKSAFLIQKCAQVWLSRRYFIRQRSRAVVLQRWYRLSLVKEEIRIKRELAAVAIQRLIRGHQARAKYICVQKAAVRLQNAVRASKARQRYEEKRVAILLIQDMWRSQMTRTRIEELHASINAGHLEADQAVLIQRAWRRYFALSAYRTLLCAGVLVIQSHARTWQAQREFTRQRDTATIIQMWYRLSIKHQASKQRINAAIVIQQYTRSRSIRLQQINSLAAVTRVQATFRASHGRFEYEKKRAAVRLIQKTWRSALLAAMIRQQACARIQSLARGNYVRETQNKASRSALMIQKTWRRYDAFSAYQTLKCLGVLVIQKYTRAWMCKIHFTVKRHAAIKIQRWYNRTIYEQTAKRSEMAVVILQRNIRRYQARIKYLSIFAQTQRIRSILSIQSMVRAVLQRKKYGNLRLATIFIQSLARRKVQRNKYLGFKAGIASLRALERRAQLATLTIQSFVRRALIQSRARAKRDAAIKIQMQARSRSLTRMKHAAVLLQAWLRGSMVRGRLRTEQENATSIQAAFRRHACHTSFTRVVEKVKLLQSIARGRRQRKMSTKLLGAANLRRKKEDAHMLALIRFQASVRAQLASRLYERQKSAVRVLQRAYFRWKMALTLLNVQSSIVLLKRSMRGQLERSATRFALSHVNASLQIYDHISKEAGFGPDSIMISSFSNAKSMAQNSAVVVLQSAARRFLAVARKKRMLQHTFETTRWRVEPTTLLKSVFSRFSQRNVHEQHHRAATVIQTNYRRHHQLSKYHRLHGLATALQGCYRVRLSMAKVQDMKTRAAAATSAKEAAVEHSVHTQQTASAIVVQRAYRVFSRRTEEEQRHGAAAKVQSLHRRNVQLQDYSRLREAATVIQSLFRMNLSAQTVRAQTTAAKYHQQAATTLQAMYRRRLHLARYSQLRGLAISLQALSRMRISMTEVQVARAKATAEFASSAAETRAAVRLQACARCYQARIRYCSFLQASLVLQSFWRRSVCFIRFKRLCSAVIKIQRWSVTMKTGTLMRLKHAEAMELCKHDLEKAILLEMERKAMDQVGLMLLKSPRKVRRTSACVRRLARRVKSVSRQSESKENSAPNSKTVELPTVPEHDGTLPSQSLQQMLPFQESQLS